MKINDEKFSTLQMALLIDDWKTRYHVNSKHELIFQCKPLLTNVRFPSEFMHKNHMANRGFSNLPDTIEKPSECWSYWVNPDPKKQKDVVRNYILRGDNINYVVTTESGIIKKAIAVVNSKLSRYRKGLIIYRSK